MIDINQYINLKVKEIRKLRSISQENLSLSIGKNISFISQVESSKTKAKYNVVHLNLIACVLKYSPKDFWPEKSICCEDNTL